jgi:hypothetical protein
MPSDRVSGLVVVAAFSGGGSGDFTFLQILDVTAAHAFNFDGKIYAFSQTGLRKSGPFGTV